MKPKLKLIALLLIATILVLLYSCRVVYSKHPLPSEQPVVKNFPSNFKGEYKVVGPMDKTDLLDSKYPQKLFEMFWNIEINDGVCTIKQYYGFQTSKTVQINAHRDFKVENDILFYRNDSLKIEIVKLSNKSTPLTENEQYDLEYLFERDKKGELEQNFPLIKKPGHYIFDSKTAYKIDVLHNDFTDYTLTDKPVKVKVAFKQEEDYMFFNLKEGKKDWLPIVLKLDGNLITVSRIDPDNLNEHFPYYSSIIQVTKKKEKSKTYIIDPSQANLLSFLKEPRFLTTIAVLEKSRIPLYKKPWLFYTAAALVLLVILFWLLASIFKQKKQFKP